MNATTWRLIQSPPADGAWNMSVDEAMLDAGVAGLIPPTLRFYAWQPAAVSLGFFQPLDDRIDVAEIAHRGFGLVRRPSGGRAILHKDELTYSVVVPESLIEDGRSVMGSYRALSRGIEAGLRRLGLGAEMPDRRHAPRMKADGLPTVCFASSAGGDMVADGRKIVGSAQTRRRGVIMQHGSVPIHIDPAEHLAVMPGEGTDEASQQRLLEKACGVADVLGRPLTFEELAEALRQGFAERFGIKLEEGTLTDWEQARAQELHDTRYATDAWNHFPAKRGEEQGSVPGRIGG
jgi:lipoyl(octanoyl) transferase